MTNGVWKKYIPPRFHRMQIERIEMELHQKVNQLIWKRIVQQSQESPKERSRRKESNKVIEKNRKYTNQH